MKLEPCNFSALIDLFQTSGHLSSHSEKFESKMYSEVNNPCWAAFQKSQLYFVAGSHYFVMKKFSNAIEHWILSESLKDANIGTFVGVSGKCSIILKVSKCISVS